MLGVRRPAVWSSLVGFSFHASGARTEFGEDRMTRILVSNLVSLKHRAPLILALGVTLRELGALEAAELIRRSYRSEPFAPSV